jgi:MSHA pilin protein MshC
LFSKRCNVESGFTLVELVVVLVMVGILSVFIAPRLSRDSFATRTTADQAQSMLRYAQKIAIAQHRKVYVVFGASGGSLNGSLCFTPNCSAIVMTPAGKPATIGLPSDVSANINPVIAGLYFDGLGRPFNLTDSGTTSSFQKTTLTIQGNGVAWKIVVEPETGYVHQP